MPASASGVLPASKMFLWSSGGAKCAQLSTLKNSVRNYTLKTSETLLM
jgi:hypothetical protein